MSAIVAIVSAVKHFRLYLQGKFTIRTDHKGLTWLYSQKNFPNRLMYIQQYNFTVEYIPGTDAKMATADFLSRQGHNVNVQGVQITCSCDIADGTPELASIFGADEFRIYQLEDTALYDVRLAIQNGSKTIS